LPLHSWVVSFPRRLSDYRDQARVEGVSDRGTWDEFELNGAGNFGEPSGSVRNEGTRRLVIYLRGNGVYIGIYT
jgi:hypothetical protein